MKIASPKGHHCYLIAVVIQPLFAYSCLSLKVWSPPHEQITELDFQWLHNRGITQLPK